MKIEWFKCGDNLSAVTIYANNICLNKQASNYFLDAYAVAVGIDKETKNIIIKNVSKEEVEALKIDKNSLNKIAIKSSYGRITGKTWQMFNVKIPQFIEGSLCVEFGP